MDHREHEQYQREYDEYDERLDEPSTTVIHFPKEIDRTFLSVTRFLYGLETESRKHGK